MIPSLIAEIQGISVIPSGDPVEWLARGSSMSWNLCCYHIPEVVAGEIDMTLVHHNPAELFPPYRGYVHAAEIAGGSRLLFISGINGYERDGTSMPESFEEQAELIWKHIRTILASAGMDVTNLVSLRTYLADPKYDEPNALMRAKQLGAHRVASTVVCCQLLETKWKLEIEAVAAA